MEILLSVTYSLLFIWLISRFRFFQLDGIPKFWIIAVFALKVACGVAFWYVYTYHYPNRKDADIYKYFDDSKIMFDALQQYPTDFFRMLVGLNNAHIQEQYYSHMQLWSPHFENLASVESHTMIRLNALFRLFSMGFYQVHSVFINLLSFAGLLALYKTFSVYVPDRKKLLFFAIFLTPTVLFWGSAVIKESFALFAMGFSIYYLHRLLSQSFAVKTILLALLFLWILFMIKLILAVFVVIAFAGWLISLRMNSRFVFLNFILVSALAFVLTIACGLFSSHNYFKTLVTKQVDFINTANGGLYISNANKMVFIPYNKKEQLLERLSDSLFKIKPNSSYYYYNMPNSADTIYVKNVTDTLTYKLFSMSEPAQEVIRIPLLDASPWRFIAVAPKAFIAILTRPNLFDSKGRGLLILFAAIENAIVALLFLLCILFASRVTLNQPAFWFCITIVLGYYIIIGWVVPLFGTIVRYKTSALPLLMIALLMLYRKRKSIEN